MEREKKDVSGERKTLGGRNGTGKERRERGKKNVSGKRGNDTDRAAWSTTLRAYSAGLGMRDHRSLHAWQEARAVVLGTIEQRASLSVQLNIAEGYAFGESPTYTRHLRIAYGSAVETGELLEIALKADIVAPERGIRLLTRNQRSQRLLLGMLRRKH